MVNTTMNIERTKIIWQHLGGDLNTKNMDVDTLRG